MKKAKDHTKVIERRVTRRAFMAGVSAAGLGMAGASVMSGSARVGSRRGPTLASPARRLEFDGQRAMLAKPENKLQDHYTVIVIGSGYGASIAASRLARAGQQVCVLERGKEFRPGEYPNDSIAGAAQMQADTPEGRVGSETGLYEFSVNENMSVFKGCGLGGTSLVNANVSLRAEPRVFADPRWPHALRDDLDTLLREGYQRAEQMLKPAPYPADFPKLAKLEALQKSARALGAHFYRPPLNVNFDVEGLNHVGVEQHKCVCCGDCVTGCNYHAKNTLIMNYLPDAKNHGAEIFTEVVARWIERRGGRWLVHCDLLGVGRQNLKAASTTVSADVLILGAGTLGSTEILLRSRDHHGLQVSNELGKHFTGNGDVLAFGYDTDQVINGVGFGDHKPGELDPVGPCITGIIDLRQQPTLEDGLVIEEGAAPGPTAGLLPGTLAAAAAAAGEKGESSIIETVKQGARTLKSWTEGPYRGAVHNTQTFLVMTHDNASGRMRLKDDRLRIDWPNVGTEPIFKTVNQRLLEATRALGGTFVHNPDWSKLFHRSLVTVHPLGGCIMAEDAASGVVNHKGQAFCAAQGAEVYANLYVCDGAVIPRSLGVNPLLTISALAERCAALIAKDRGWQIDYSL